MTDWVPGDPLHTWNDYAHGGYVFNFRHESYQDECSCADSARWPTPRSSWINVDTTPDELTVFIEEYHRWVREG